MDDLLTPVSTTYRKPKRDTGGSSSQSNNVSREVGQGTKGAHLSSADDALEGLKSQPDYETLIAVLRFLTTDSLGPTSFHLQAPGPKGAAIIHLLVAEIAPNYWTVLSEGSAGPGPEDRDEKAQDADLLTQCLRSVTGLNAILAQVRALIQKSRGGRNDARRTDVNLHLDIYLDLLASLLAGDDAIQTLWKSSTSHITDSSLKKAQSQSLVSLIAGGRIPSLAAEAQQIVAQPNKPQHHQWLSNGAEYSKWIGRNVSHWAYWDVDEIEVHVCSALVQKGMSLGYAETLIEVIINQLLLSQNARPRNFASVCLQETAGSKKVMGLLIEHLSEKFLTAADNVNAAPEHIIAAVAGVIDAVVDNDATRKNHLVNWSTASSGAGLGDGTSIRRAVLAVLAKDKEVVTTVFEKSLNQFGDELYIKHVAMLQQQVHTEVLLISAGYVKRLSPIKLAIQLRSSTYLRTISNRIAATQVKARFLGMVVGECLTALNDGQGKQLSFNMEETDTEEAQRLKQLVHVHDPVGPSAAIQSNRKNSTPIISQRPTSNAVTKRVSKKPKLEATQPKPRAIIEEVDSSNESDEDEDLVPYAKNSDPEDSDEDPTLVQRIKIKPPVYIRDLITFLRDSENYDKQKLALQTAPVLIRRKANYGTEVSAHAVELARLLVGVQDKFEIDDFLELRQQSMIALVTAQPKAMAPWFARTFFEGDYSLSQRTSVLVTLGLSARELAGFDVSENQAAASFPSKRLPQKMEQLYLEPTETQGKDAVSQLQALPASALTNITQSLTSSFLEPLAAEAADATTGPDVLKLQSFTARYKSKTKARPRIRAIPNTTASLLATSFFSPLTAHFQFALHSSRPIVLNPTLLSLYLQTLGIIIHAAGPSTLALPQLTSELWDLLLGTRTHVLDDLGSMKGWLVAMAALLEVNEGDMRRLCEAQGREVVETREWVGAVFERTRGDDGGEENDVKMLAAGVLIKLGEAIEKYQAMLMGDMIGYS